MSNPELSFRISAESRQAREELRRVAEQLRGMGNSARQGLAGLPSLSDGLSRVGAAGQVAGRAAQQFGSGLAGAVPQLGNAMASLRGVQQATFGLPPVMGAAAMAGAALGAALVAVGVRSVQAFAAMETQMLTTTQVIRATGGAAGKSWDDINRMAINLGRNTLASTEGVRSAATQLLTFRSIAGETFDRTIRAAQDLAAVGFGTVESASVQLGKALENPEQGLAALTEVGVSFSVAQKEVIKQLMATGQVAAAQSLILQQIESQVGGAGAAGGGGLAGAFNELSNSSNRFFEIIGGGLVRLFSLDTVIGSLAGAVSNLNDAMTASPDQLRTTELEKLLADRERLLALDEARPAGSFWKMNDEGRAELLNEIALMQGELAAIADAAARKKQEADRKSAEEQRKIAEERFQGVVAALRAEGEQAGLTKTEIEALNAARKAGVDPSLPENVARYQEILALVRQTAEVRAQASGEKMLADLEQEVELQRAIAAHGADSAEVTRLRAAHERAALEQQIAAAGYADDLAQKILEAFDNAKALEGVNIAAGVNAAVTSASALVQKFGMALDLATAIAGLGMADNAPALADDDRGSQREVSADAREAVSARARAAAARRAAKYQASLLPKEGGGGGGAGGADGDTVAGLSKQGVQMLQQLEIAQATVAEKVRAGLLTVAEGTDAVGSAKRRAAEQLAELIARLDRLGPAGKTAADTARQALADLGVQAESVGESLRKSLTENFEENFARSIASGKSAMTAFSDHVLMELSRAFTKKFITPFITPLIDGLMGLLPFAQGGVVGSRGVMAFADGGVPNAPLSAHSNSVVSRPTLFAMGDGGTGLMGEAGPEAILPLRQGAQGLGVLATGPGGATVLPLQRSASGALGVRVPDMSERLRPPRAFAQGGIVGRMASPPALGMPSSDASGTPRAVAPTVNIINNHPEARIERRERSDGQGMTLDVIIEQVEAAVMERAARGVGPMDAFLGDRYGLSRVGR